MFKTNDDFNHLNIMLLIPMYSVITLYLYCIGIFSHETYTYILYTFIIILNIVYFLF